MKIEITIPEITIPDELFLEVVHLAKRLDITIQEFFCQALSDYIKGCETAVQDSQLASDSVQDALDAVYSREDSGVEEVLAKMQWASLPCVRPKIESTARNPHPYCLCGCEVENKPKSKFKPGHDAKLKSIIGHLKNGKDIKPTDVISDELIEAARNVPKFGVVGYTALEILSIAGDRPAREDW